MIDWQWIPGVVVAVPALAHTLWLRKRFDDEIVARATELHRQIMDQAQHGLMLWPRPWAGGRAMTQVEELVEAGKTWLGEPLDPEEQMRLMREQSQALLDSYKPKDDR